MQNRLQELTEKIYREGVSKANEEGDKILADAKNEAKRIIEEASKKAASIEETATKKAEEIIKNGNSELKISFRHAVNTLRQDLEKTISHNIISEKAGNAFNDDNFIADLIITIFRNWTPAAGGSGMEVMIPAGKSAEIEKKLKATIASELGKNLVIKPVNTIDAGFEIKPSEGGFKISATEGDIESYLKEFIRPKLKEILFEEK